VLGDERGRIGWRGRRMEKRREGETRQEDRWSTEQVRQRRQAAAVIAGKGTSRKEVINGRWRGGGL